MFEANILLQSWKINWEDLDLGAMNKSRLTDLTSLVCCLSLSTSNLASLISMQSPTLSIVISADAYPGDLPSISPHPLDKQVVA